MVRLKERTTVQRMTYLSQFQFHYGTIKRRQVIMCLYTKYDFNSTMVRLKESEAPFNSTDSIYFNSTMVRLKESQGFFQLVTI